eukprot:TRINITY_DN16017_c0_g1_i1.p1 TRINITY_DN16017_c0_g1~~TRINITY_DN16017_c0_g1_i1.p1  ORF type:complete len:804 (+),score=127.37 TRINITY_DN16017_c0_g1_i1:63-2474(+)
MHPLAVYALLALQPLAVAVDPALFFNPAGDPDQGANSMLCVPSDGSRGLYVLSGPSCTSKGFANIATAAACESYGVVWAQTKMITLARDTVEVIAAGEQWAWPTGCWFRTDGPVLPRATLVPPTLSPPTVQPPTALPATPAPVTPAPATPMPPTAGPPTPTPATPTPPSPAPPTPTPPTPRQPTALPPLPQPQTPVPFTAVSSTVQPPTAVPATAVPETPAPARMQMPGPPTTAPLALTAEEETTAAPFVPAPRDALREGARTVAATMGLATASLMLTTQAARADQFMKLAKCPPDAEAVEFLDSPTGMGRRTGTNNVDMSNPDVQQAKKLGMLGNVMVVVVLTTLHYFVVLLHYAASLACRRAPTAEEAKRGRRGATLGQSMAVCRFPSFSVFPFLTMMQPILTPAFSLLFYVHTLWDKVLALSSIAFCAAVVWCFSYWLREENFPCILESNGRGRISRWIFGAQDWTSRYHDHDVYERRFALIFRDYCHKYRWFIVFDAFVLALIAAVGGAVPDSTTQCAVQGGLMIAAVLGFMLFAIRLNPYLAPCDRYIIVVSSLLQAAGLLLALMCVLKEGRESPLLVQSSRVCIVISTAILLVKGLLDLVVFVWHCVAACLAARRTAAESHEAHLLQRYGDEEQEEMEEQPQVGGEDDTPSPARGCHRAYTAPTSQNSPADSGTFALPSSLSQQTTERERTASPTPSLQPLRACQLSFAGHSRPPSVSLTPLRRVWSLTEAESLEGRSALALSVSPGPRRPRPRRNSIALWAGSERAPSRCGSLAVSPIVQPCPSVTSASGDVHVAV